MNDAESIRQVALELALNHPTTDPINPDPNNIGKILSDAKAYEDFITGPPVE